VNGNAADSTSHSNSEKEGGAIYIDGINIANIPVQLLRKHLGLIPQDPLLFSESLRFNLDPFQEYNDVQLWEVLMNVQMKDKVLALKDKLLEPVGALILMVLI